MENRSASLPMRLMRPPRSVRRPRSRGAGGASALSATPAHPWVSRGGLKLVAALDHFGFDPGGDICLDVGASPGGSFRVGAPLGAARVYAVDVGRAQLHARLRGDPAVVSLEE